MRRAARRSFSGLLGVFGLAAALARSLLLEFDKSAIQGLCHVSRLQAQEKIRSGGQEWDA